MSERGHPPEAALWLALLSGQRLPRRTAKALLNAWCVRDQRRLGELCGLAPGEIVAAWGEPALSAEQATALAQALQDTAAAEATLARLAAAGVEVITRVDAPYPEELAQHLPEDELPYLLFALGALDHLAETGLGVGGAQDSARYAPQDVAQLATGLATWPVVLVSGFERGAARDVALQVAQAGGRLTVLLPLGMDHAQPVIAPLRAALDEGRVLFLSPFQPEQPYSERNAQARRALLSALVDALLLIEPDAGPASWPGADVLLARGGVVVLAQRDSAAVEEWAQTGALVLGSPAGALMALAPEESGEGERGGEPGVMEATDRLAGVEPIYFQDADEALVVLGRAGRVPDGLARRLRESGWFGGQDSEDIDVAADTPDQDIDAEGEKEDEP